MSKEKSPSLKKNYIYRLFYDLLTVITPFITTPYASRILGADGIGIYSFTNSIITYFTLFAALGTVSYGAREIAQHRDSKEETSKLFWEIEIMTIITSAICIIVWLFVILFSQNYRIYFIASSPLIFATMFDISWYFTGYEKVKNIVVRNSLCKIASIICLFIFVNDKNDVVIYIIINSVVMLVGNLSMWTYLPGMLTKVDFKTLTIKRHLKETLVYFIPTIATSIYTVLDKTLIGVITGDDYQNGYYEQATKVVNIIKHLVFTSVNFIMGARISYLFAKNAYDEIKAKIEKSLGFILFLGFGAMFGIIGVAQNFVPMFFGKGYDEVIALLVLMSPLVVIIGFSNCLGGQYYTPSGQRAKSAKYIIAGSLINLVLNICFIPFLSAKGAVIASIIAELSISILYVRNCNGFMTVKIIINNTWKRLISGAAMCAVILLIGKYLSLSHLALFIIQIVVGGMIYLILLYLMKDKTLNWLLNMLKTNASKLIKRRRNG